MSFQINRQLAHLHDCDVLVIGGGPAGTAAAISAARMGKDAALVERSGQLGGMMTLGNVAIFMPVGRVTGLYAELVATHCKEFYTWGKSYPRCQFNAVNMRYDCLRRAAEAGVKIFFHTEFLSVLKNGAGEPCGIAAHTREGLGAITGKILVDCTGDAHAAIDAGAAYSTGRPGDGATQPMTLMFEMQDTGKAAEPYIPEGAYRYGSVDELPQGRVLYFDRNNEGRVLVNMTRVRGNGTDFFNAANAELEAMKQMYGVAEYLQKNIFPNHCISSAAPQVGVRQTRQIEGEYKLTADDLINGSKFSDVVTQTNYEVDIHNPTGKGGTEEYPVKFYDIPYRCMLPKNVTKLLVAGRCISADHTAMSSLRTIPTCLGLGQAAGVAASAAIDDGCALKDVNIEKLHAGLKSQGVQFFDDAQ
ncbi:MAG: FAD-dependent oxidoreductase [Defluviitaleaceae bacterium]|nr:FAD-dependent oxidoreductase [Defluviitaleaceae bacterium]